MTPFAILAIVVTLSISGFVEGQPGQSGFCNICDQVKDPSRCTSMEKCHRGEHECYTKVEFFHGEYVYTKGCKHECTNIHLPLTSGAIGKRRPHEHGDIVCQECCIGIDCNTHQCERYLATTTVAPPPTTTKPLPACRDHNIDGFVCSDYAIFNFCTDTSSFAHKIALEQCPNYCGFCDANGNYKDTSLLVPTAPAAPVTTAAMASTPEMPTTTQATVICADKEDDSFNCAQWASYGFCTQGSGTGFTIAMERCQKTCGICT